MKDPNRGTEKDWLVEPAIMRLHSGRSVIKKIKSEKSPKRRLKAAIGMLFDANRKGNSQENDLIARTLIASLWGEKGVAPGLKWLRSSAKAGNPHSQATLANCLLKDDYGVKKNKNLAFKWAEKSALQNNPRGELLLVYFYSYGIVTPKDNAAAFRFAKKAADKNDAHGIYQLAYFYRRGLGTKMDLGKAFLLFKDAANRGIKDATYELGLFYRWGWGVQKSPHKAFSFFQKAFKADHRYAGIQIGDCYRWGFGTTKNEKKAYSTYKKIAEMEVPYAQQLLGDCFRYGIGIKRNLKTAFNWYTRAAEQDLSTAQMKVGEFHYFGHGVDKDYKQALDWYKKSAKPGYPLAQYRIGVMYEWGRGTKRDLHEAFEWFRKASDGGNKFAQFKLGEFFENGRGDTEKNFATACVWFQKAGDQGHKEALYRLGKIYSDEFSDLKKAFQAYRQAADLNHGKATIELADYYLFGHGTDKNLEEVFKLLKKVTSSIDPGYIPKDRIAYAIYRLAECHLLGLGTQPNNKSAFRLFTKAANLGHAYAKYRLGLCHFRGWGTSEDREKGFSLILKAAQKGVSNAQYTVARCYKSGSGTSKDIGETFIWLKKAATQNNADAQNGLGYLYFEGKEFTKDLDIALRWFKKAAGQGNSNGMHSLGECHRERKESKAAFSAFKNAAERGLPAGAFDLALCYRDAIGIGKNLKLANFWLEKSADAGYPRAKKLLAEHYAKGIGVEKDKEQGDLLRKQYKETKDHPPTSSRPYWEDVSLKEAGKTNFQETKKAAEKGDAEAQAGMGLAYGKGVGVERDEEKAIDWYKKSAAQGNPVAKVNIAFEYETGIRLKKNRPKAIKLYLEVAQTDNPIRIIALSRLSSLSLAVNYGKSLTQLKRFIKMGRSLNIFGPRGTGKTEFASRLLPKSKASFFSGKSSDDLERLKEISWDTKISPPKCILLDDFDFSSTTLGNDDLQEICEALDNLAKQDTAVILISHSPLADTTWGGPAAKRLWRRLVRVEISTLKTDDVLTTAEELWPGLPEEAIKRAKKYPSLTIQKLINLGTDGDLGLPSAEKVNLNFGKVRIEDESSPRIKKWAALNKILSTISQKDSSFTASIPREAVTHSAFLLKKNIHPQTPEGFLAECSRKSDLIVAAKSLNLDVSATISFQKLCSRLIRHAAGDQG